jgi:CPA2 family monovalent cation:H+ antiporter-2
MVFEVGLALILIAIVSVVAQRLKQSIIPFLIILGMLVGPHLEVLNFGSIDLTFVHSQETISFLGRIGILFLLFFLGVEFSVQKMVKSGRSIIIGGTVYVAMNFVLGLIYGLLVDLGIYEALITAGMLSVSSTAIVAKVLVDLKRTGNPETELILGIILFDDLFLAVFMSIMSGVLLGDTSSPLGVIVSVLISMGYMLLFFIIARKGPPILNRLLNITSNEVFIIVVFAVLFFVAGFSEKLHVAEAIGALLLGLALSETEHAHRIAQMVIPFRDFFGALFFFSFGLSIDPYSLLDAVWLALGAVLITVVSNYIAGLVSGKQAGLSVKSSTNIGLTIMARGEFTIIVAALGVSAGLNPILQPFSALYVLIMAVIGPIIAKQSKLVYTGLAKIGIGRKELEKQRAKAKVRKGGET